MLSHRSKQRIRNHKQNFTCSTYAKQIIPGIIANEAWNLLVHAKAAHVHLSSGGGAHPSLAAPKPPVTAQSADQTQSIKHRHTCSNLEL